MDESESKKENRNGQKRRFDPELLKKGLRCDLDQYEFLKQCSEKGDEGINEWNERRKTDREEDIYLEGAKFSSAHLKGVDLWHSYLKKAVFHHVDLRYAKLGLTHLEGAEFKYAKIQGANFPFCIVDGETLFLGCEIDHHTWFYAVGLGMVRIDTRVKELLEYNVRRGKWVGWYWGYRGGETWWLETTREKRMRVIRAIPRLIFTFPVRVFWSFSNYGISTWRVIIWFLVLSLLFATIYANCAYWWPLGIVSNLTVEPHLPIWHYFLLLLLRPIYFSVVTMTTLGFGDMYANAQSIWGHILLSLQVILGYVLLGALVTRFAVLFTAGGPAGRFANEKKKKDKTCQEQQKNGL